MVGYIEAQAKQEESVKKAFVLSDFARDIVSIVCAKGIDLLQAAPEVLTQGATALVEGAVKGVATTLDPHHWAEMLNPQTWIEAAKGVAALAGSVSNLIAAEEAQGDAFLVSAVTGNDEFYLQKHQEFIAACDEFAGGALQQLQAMSWEELLQGGAELATTFVLDGFVMKAATLYGTKAGKALIKNLAEAIKADSAPERMVELAGIGKIALEEGVEEAIAATESVKNNQSFLFKKDHSAVKFAPEKERDLLAKKITVDSDKIRKIDKNILDEMEALKGHALEKHVTKLDHDLINRGIEIVKEAKKKGKSMPNTESISCFSNKSIAIEAVQQNLRNNANQIAEWLNDKNGILVKVCEYDHSYKIGKGVACGKKGGIKDFRKSRVILVKDDSHSLGFIIKTAFPIEE